MWSFATLSLFIIKTLATYYYDNITTPMDGQFKLYGGDRLYSQAQDTYLQMKTTGECVLKITESGDRIWDSDTHIDGSYLQIRYNGNMRIRDSNDNTLWETDTSDHQDTQPHSLVVYHQCVYLINSQLTVLWSAGPQCSYIYPLATFGSTISPTISPATSSTLSLTSQLLTVYSTNHSTQTSTDLVLLTITKTESNISNVNPNKQQQQTQWIHWTVRVVLWSIGLVLFITIIVVVILVIKYRKIKTQIEAVVNDDYHDKIQHRNLVVDDGSKEGHNVMGVIPTNDDKESMESMYDPNERVIYATTQRANNDGKAHPEEQMILFYIP